MWAAGRGFYPLSFILSKRFFSKPGKARNIHNTYSPNNYPRCRVLFKWNRDNTRYSSHKWVMHVLNFIWTPRRIINTLMDLHLSDETSPLETTRLLRPVKRLKRNPVRRVLTTIPSQTSMKLEAPEFSHLRESCHSEQGLTESTTLIVFDVVFAGFRSFHMEKWSTRGLFMKS